MILREHEDHKLEAFEEMKGVATIEITWFECESMPEEVKRVHVNKADLLKILAMMEGEE